jgi:hypothetical protein
MARPKIFVSSTYYDLRHIRSNLELFISELGYDAILFENGSVAFDPALPLDESCYDEVKACDIFVLILGGRYGSIASSEAKSPHEAGRLAMLNSVTKKEYLTARDKDIPIYIFVEKAVASEFRTYQKNRANKKIKYAHVDNVAIFSLLDDIYKESRNNLIREFEKAKDIESWLKDQWAGLFAQLIRARSTQRELHDLSAQLSELNAITDGLKNYSEVMLKTLKVKNVENVISETDQKIHKAREEDFIVSPMITFLVRRARRNGLPVHVRQWVSAFQSSKDSRQFLQTIGFSGDSLESLVKDFGDALERDFHRYRLRYFDMPLPDAFNGKGAKKESRGAPPAKKKNAVPRRGGLEKASSKAIAIAKKRNG